MILLLGDYVTVTRELVDDVTIVSGKVSGIVLNEAGGLQYIYVKGIAAPLWMSDNWQFDTEEESNENE